RGPAGVHAPLEDPYAHLPAPGAGSAAHRFPVHGDGGRDDVRAPAQTAVGEALGRQDHECGHYTQDSAGRRSLRTIRVGKPAREMSLEVSTMRGAALTLAAALFPALPAQAHHAFAAEFDDKKPLHFTDATVTKVELINPHSWIHVDVKREDGTVENWA